MTKKAIKKIRKRPRKKLKKTLFFLIAFLVKFLFSYFLDRFLGRVLVFIFIIVHGSWNSWVKHALSFMGAVILFSVSYFDTVLRAYLQCAFAKLCGWCTVHNQGVWLMYSVKCTVLILHNFSGLTLHNLRNNQLPECVADVPCVQCKGIIYLVARMCGWYTVYSALVTPCMILILSSCQNVWLMYSVRVLPCITLVPTSCQGVWLLYKSCGASDSNALSLTKKKID